MVSFVGDGTSPVLGEPTDGLSLYVFDGGSLRRLELDNGRATTLGVRQDTGWNLLEVRGDRVVMSGGPYDWSAARDLSDPRTHDDELQQGMRVRGSDLRWSQEGRDGKVYVMVTRGEDPQVRIEIPSGFTVNGFVGDRVVLVGGGRIFTMGLDGRVEHYASGTVVGLTAQWILHWSCDDQARCAFRLGTATDPDAIAVRMPERIDTANGYWWGGPDIVAPDARVALLPRQGSMALVDIATGDVLVDVPGWGGWAWSPDSRWLFTFDDDDSVVAVSTDDGRQVDLELPVSRNSGNRLLAVG
jgi:hypothetical protein